MTTAGGAMQASPKSLDDYVESENSGKSGSANAKNQRADGCIEPNA